MAAGCASEGVESIESTEDDLTSLTARSRALVFDAYVYVRVGASNSEIEAAIKRQNQSAFGATRTADIGVNRRELKITLAELDPKYFSKTEVNVVDAKNPNAPATKMLKVQYRYTDTAVVPVPMANKSSASLAVLAGNYQLQAKRILAECTPNAKHDIDFEDSIWYVFDPSLSKCKAAMSKEQSAIEADRALVGPGNTPSSEINRLYVPITVSLGRDSTNDKISYPEYDQLYRGGVKKGRLVIGMVNGIMADWAAGEKHELYEDYGYPMWFEGLEEIFKSRPEFKFARIDGNADLKNFVIAGKTGTSQTVVFKNGFADIMAMEVSGKRPEGVTYDNLGAVRKVVAERLARKWLSFEAPVRVKIGNEAEREVVIELNTYFGAETDAAPYKRAVKGSDIFVYNGHSYIGYGPLDPKNFRASDFPSTYQMMFVNGCVSYNYYHQDYFPLKGGTKRLDLVTNGLESWVAGSGGAMGRFIGAIVNGRQSSYKEILKASQFLPNELGYSWGRDALRLVDGELDNTYSPATSPIKVRSSTGSTEVDAGTDGGAVEPNACAKSQVKGCPSGAPQYRWDCFNGCEAQCYYGTLYTSGRNFSSSGSCAQ